MLTQKQIPLLDLQAQFSQIRREILDAVTRVIDSQKFILGDEVAAFETEIAGYCRTPFAVTCASGTDALFLALMAAGVSAGDQVVTTPYSFFATAGAIARLGAIPVFADIDPATGNIDPRHAAEAIARSSRARAIIPVHLFGGCAEMDEICGLAARHQLVVIEDAAQAIGAEYRGRRAGGMGHIACFSFYPTKNLSAFGDGGLVTTQDPQIAEHLRALRVHGSTGKYIHQWVGFNSRLDALQAAVLRVKLRHLDAWTRQRQENARIYHDALAQSPARLPCPAPYQTRHVFNQFVIRAPRRDALREYLASQGVGTEIYYPMPLHLQPCFSSLGYHTGDFPESEAFAQEALALPIYAELPADDVRQIAHLLSAFYSE